MKKFQKILLNKVFVKVYTNSRFLQMFSKQNALLAVFFAKKVEKIF